MDTTLVDELVKAAHAVVASRAIAANGHGNFSIRVPGAEEMLFTSAPSLNALGPDNVCHVGLDGALLEGSLPPIQGAIVAMHTMLYRNDPDVGSVLHTHAPGATAFAVARRPIECWIEAMAMFGLADGVPVAAYAPRGSDQAVANIETVLRPACPPSSSRTTGCWYSIGTPDLAVLVNGVVEEAAQASIAAESIGGPIVIDPELRAAALQRAMAFSAAGTRTI